MFGRSWTEWLSHRRFAPAGFLGCILLLLTTPAFAQGLPLPLSPPRELSLPLSLPTCTLVNQPLPPLELGTTSTATIEPNWTVSAVSTSPTPSSNPNISPYHLSSAQVAGIGGWAPISNWVQPSQTSTAYGKAAGGYYTYQIQFVIPCSIASYGPNIAVTGTYWADNSVTTILMNNNFGTTCSTPSCTCSTSLCFKIPGTPFAFNHNTLRTGLNTLTIVVQNDGPSWTGLAVTAELSGAICGAACVPPTGLIKVCKVAGPGVPVGAPFTFTIGSSVISIGSTTITVPAGAAPAGACVDGPSLPVGTIASVTETIPAGDAVSSITVAPSAQLVTTNLATGNALVTIGTGDTVVTYTDIVTAKLEVIKTVVNDTARTINFPATAFTANVACSGPSFFTPTPVNLPVPVDPNLPNHGSVSSPTAPLLVPIFDSCTVTEGMLPAVPNSAIEACNRTDEVPFWTTTISPSQPVIITTVGATYTVTITNTLKCERRTALEVIKRVVNDTEFPLTLPAMTFSVNVTCQPNSPASGSLNLAVGATNGLPNNGGSVTGAALTTQVTQALGETCAVTETASPAVPAGAECGTRQGGAVSEPIAASWSTTITPPNISITAGTNTVIVTNTLACSLAVAKSVSPDPAGVASQTQFPITVNCTPPVGSGAPTSTTLNLWGNSTALPIPNLPYGTVCKFSESPLPANFKFNGLLCSWQTPTYLPQQVTIGQITNPPNYEKVSNFYTCRLERSQDSGACTPPMISGPTPNSCVCPQGMQMEGKECVIVQRVCPAPMVPSSVRGECVCPAGTVLTGNKCVHPVVCRPPLVPNAADTACACPEGTVLTGKKCVCPSSVAPH